jgi:hypothetical protein
MAEQRIHNDAPLFTEMEKDDSWSDMWAKPFNRPELL